MDLWSKAFVSAALLGLVAVPSARAGDWTGCYVGGNLGWIGEDAHTVTSPAARWLIITTPAQQATVTRSASFDESGFTGGAQVGCNWQLPTHNIVLGLETDFNGSTGLDQQATVVYPPVAPYLGRTDTIGYKLDWFGTLRGRIGYAWDSVMLYATGGLAYGRVGETYHAVLTDSTIYDGSTKTTRTGWTLGGGGEWAFAENWTARGEYLHIDLGSFTHDAYQVNNPLFAWRSDVETRADIVRVGVNYTFSDLLPMP